MVALLASSMAGDGWSGARPAAGNDAPAAVASANAANTSTSGAVSGTVKLQGLAPKPAPINMAKEPECVKLHPTPAKTEEVLTGANGELENVVVYISEGLGDRSFDPPSEPAVIDQKGCVYHPHVIVLQANQKLRVVNSDPTSHNIHPLPQNNREWNKSQPPGLPPIESSFAREEIAIPVKCNVHPWMRSYIAVFKHPYFTVTSQAGSFDLKNLPPGNYTITAWHEKYGTQSQQVSIVPKETKTVDFTFKVRAAH
jgi:hypothetical protein